MIEDLPLVLKTGFIAIGIVVIALIGVGCASLGAKAARGKPVLENRGTRQPALLAAEGRLVENPGDAAARLDYAARLYEFGAFREAGEVLAPELSAEKPAPAALVLAAKLEYLSGRFVQAADHARAALERDAEASPSVRRGESLAALTYACYQTGDYSASPDIPRGTVFPEGWEEEVRGLGAMMKAFGSETPNRVEWRGSNEAILPFLVTDPLPVVEVAINGKKIYALIDTGGASFILDTDVARTLGLKAIAKSRGVFAFGIASEIAYGKADSLELGGVAIRSAPIWIKPTKLMSQALTGGTYEIGGIIGTNVLQRFLATVDYPGRRLVLRRRASDRVTGSAYDAAPAGARTPFYLADTHCLMVEGSLGDRDGLVFFMDSGLAHSESGFIVPIQTLDFLGIPTPETAEIKGIGGSGKNAGRIGEFEIDRLSFGPVERRGEKGLYGIVPADWYGAFGFIMDGLVSHHILRDYAWTIDFDRMEMTFAR